MKKRLMAITFAALMATSMMGSAVFAATDGGSVAGKTSLADTNFDTDYQPQKMNIRFTVHTKIYPQLV